MAVGPVQLLVLGFKHSNFQGEIREELDRLRDNDLIRVIDALGVRKDADGEEGFELGAERGAEAVAERGGVFDEEEAWDVVEEIPKDTAALLVLLEHRWAIGLRDAIARAGGFRLAAEFISPLDLVAIGLVSAEEAEALASVDSGAV
jgi:Family of unknown function (DUF6325)